MKPKTLPSLLAAAVIGIGTSQGAVLVNWDFSGLDWRSSGSTGLVTNDLAPNPILLAASSNALAGLSSTDLTPSASLRVVVNNTTAAGEADIRDFDFSGDGTNDNYVEFTLTADVAGTLNVDSISVSQWRNGAGAADGMAFDVSVNGGVFSLYDAVQVDANSGSGPSFDTFTFNEAIVGADTVAIRFTPRAVNEGSTGNIHVNNIQVNGSVPEPSSLALIGLGGFALLLRRRA
ncbi:hypothetical protein NT6N_35210 [Oceaniferula spumae]|uniref:Ice-binding protein C-terminal domain-containing protein n=1 Tax=Oceaniferula spumae TaxID=2979115 RepID=A0AAT9FR58_9BACT